MKKTELENEGIKGEDKNLSEEPKNLENTGEVEINNQIEEIKENAKNIQHEIDSLGGKDGLEEALEKNDKEANSNIFQTTKKIIAAMAALVAIPAISSMVNPETVENVKNFINSGVGETAGAIGAGILGAVAIAAMFLDKEQGIKIRDFFGPKKSILEELDQNKDSAI